MGMLQYIKSLKELRERRETLKISLLGHDKRVAELKTLIKRHKVEIAMHRTLKKQAKNQFKLKENELELKKTERLAKSLA